ncbi:MAG: DUF2341 domain-containing protein [Dehalococcoidia bacterium]|nr:DUF2341 domain-containing protein [Dehalococcoidia bacterium]
MAWLTGWNYRKPITVSNGSADYQTKVLVGESSGAVGEEVDCGGHVAADFDDLRFTAADGTTLLDYWIESITGATPNCLATVWVQNNATPDTTIYMYYGGTQTAVSSGANTFIFHDHFDGDLSKWTGNTTDFSIASSIVSGKGGGDGNFNNIYGVTQLGSVTGALRASVKFISGGLATWAVGMGFDIATALHRAFPYVTSDPVNLIITRDGTTQSNVASNITLDAYKTIDITVIGATNVRVFENGVERTNSPKTTNPPNSSALLAMLGVYDDKGANTRVQCDWILLRKYAATEPIFAFGAEETVILSLSLTEGLKAGDTPTRLMTASVSVTEGLKGGDSFSKTALMSLLASDGLKGGDTPALLAQMLPVLTEGIKLGESLSIQLGTLQQSFYPITPVEVTPGTAGSWQDVDVSAYVPAGATGVILHCVNNSTNTMRYFGFRKNGSTDARTDSLSYGTHVWATIGVDSSRIFEAYIQDITDIDVWLVGYTTSGVTFFTNAYDKSPSVLSNWEDIDCSTEAPNAIGLIFEIQNTGSLASFGLRKYGSSDNRVVQTVGYNTFAVIIGCDTAQKCQGQIADSNIKVYLVGYVTQGAIFNTNATDVSLSSTGSWIDLAALPTGSVMGFIEATSLASTNRFGLRKNGSSEAIYKYCYRHPFAMVECDSSGIIEGEISNTDVDFFLVGYAVSSLVLIITLTDGLKAGESLSLNVVMPKTLADGFKVGDSSVLNILRYLALTDGLKLGDSALTVIVKLLLLLEGLKAGDTIAVAMTAGKTLTEGLKLGDLPTELSQAWLSLAEGGKFGDSEIINLIGVMYYLTLADGLKLGDSTLRTLTALLQLVDGFKLGDVPLYSTIGELLMAWALAQSYYYVTTEVKPYFQITTEAKSYFDTTTRTGVE